MMRLALPLSSRLRARWAKIPSAPRRAQRAFGLLEVTIVLVIISILLVIYFGYQNYIATRAQAMRAAMQSDLRNYAAVQETLRSGGRLAAYVGDPYPGDTTQSIVPGFTYSRPVRTLIGRTYPDGFYLAVRNTRTELTCSLAFGDGTWADRRIHCPAMPAPDDPVTTGPAPGSATIRGTVTPNAPLTDDVLARFTLQRQPATYPLRNVRWSFSDGTTVASDSLERTFPVGTWIAIAQAEDTLGVLLADTLVVGVTPGAPLVGTLAASLTVSPATPTVGDTVTLDGRGSTAVSGRPITAYLWSWTGGGSATGSVATTVWTTPGVRRVSLTVVAQGGATASDSLTVTVGANQPPVADFTRTPASAPGINDSLTFTSTSTDPDGTIQSYAWSFGDFTTATTAIARKGYATGGTFAAALTVTDNDGASATKVDTLFISDSQFWFQAGQGVVTGSGGSVDRWNDRFGVASMVCGNSPTWTGCANIQTGTDPRSGRAVVRFSGTGPFYQGRVTRRTPSDPPSGSPMVVGGAFQNFHQGNDWTVFAVAGPAQATGHTGYAQGAATYTFDLLKSPTLANPTVLGAESGGFSLEYPGNGAAMTNSLDCLTGNACTGPVWEGGPGQMRLVMVRSRAGVLSVEFNGGRWPATSWTQGPAPLLPDGYFYIQATAAVDIGELAFFARGLTDGEVSAITSELRGRWQTQMPPSGALQVWNGAGRLANARPINVREVDGTIADMTINWGDGTIVSASNGTIVTHTYATSGLRTITLRVVDSDGLVLTRPLTLNIP